MVDMNTVIANNISTHLEKSQKSQMELAEYLAVSRQTVSEMLNGVHIISNEELEQIANFLCTSIEELTSIPQNVEEMDVFHTFSDQVKTKEARQSIQDIDTLIELILFHDNVRKNGISMKEEWTEF